VLNYNIWGRYLKQKYPNIAGRQNWFSNHPNELWTKINIQQSTSNLLTTIDVFENLEVKYCLVFGTLLGIYRDGGLIEHDTDTDIAVWLEEESKLIKTVEKMEENELMLTRFTPNIVSFTRGGDYIDVYLYRRKNAKLNELCSVKMFGTLTPSDFSKNNTVRFNDRDLACPTNLEDYFQKLYGSDWNIPIKNKHANIEHGK
jgi:phosphorylcholine metabolism protein LicD